MKNDWWDTSTVVDAPDDPRAVEQGFVIAVVEGPETGTRLTLDAAGGARALVGRGPACELRLTDKLVSRRHVAFEVTTQSEVRVTDLESTNRTLVNGVPIAEAYATDGDRVRVGDTTMRVERGDTRAVNLGKTVNFGRMIGASPAMRRLYPLCARLAASDVPALIEGETGTGKEVLAEAIHEASARAKNPFVVFDCTAVPPTLAESTLFGHERGSFTGAVAARNGVFEEAHGGTLLIDEIGELELGLQPKLLRALERGEVQRVGSNKWTKVDVRIITATRRDLDREVQAGRFRDDLFFRLAVGRIELPPLRHRQGDVALLAEQFWQKMGGASKPMPRDLIRRFEDYKWPGNIRELHNAVARVLALGDEVLNEKSVLEQSVGADPKLGGATGGDVIDGVLDAGLSLSRAREAVIHEFERRYVERVLAKHGGNVARAADASGIARRYFQILRARYRGG